jgi:mannose-6-phosphate isomerase-like protein (cupin superfamily)
MSRAGQVIESTPTGERIRFLETGRETAGELLRADLSIRPHGAVAAAHVHPNQEERFEVVSGTLRIRIGRRWRAVGPGDIVVVAPGTPHIIRNDADVEGTVIVEFRPALRTEIFLEHAFAIMNVHGLRPTPRFVAEFCTLLARFRDEMRMPWAMADALVMLVARLASRLGFRSRLTVDPDA